MRPIHLSGAPPLIVLPDAPRIYQHTAVIKLSSRPALLRAFGYLPALAGGTLEVPTQAERIILKDFLNAYAPQDLRVKLYTNNYAPQETDTEANFTEMGAVQSYAYVNLTASNWGFSGSAPVVAAYPQITWTFTAGGPTSVYGYFVIQQTSGKLMWAEEFTGAPFVVQNAGDQIQLTLQITLD